MVHRALLVLQSIFSATLLKPLLFVWAVLIQPLTIVIYKLYIVVTTRLRTFFHSQHKVLAIITHRFAVHVFVAVLALAVIFVNVGRAQEVRAEEFAEGSLVSKIFQPNEEIVITAETITPVQTSYIDSASALRTTPRLGEDISIDPGSVVVADGGAFKSQGMLGNTEDTRSQIEQYKVKEGDTASTIAAKFGVSTATVLWSNNLTDASLIKPGDTLWILPTSGVSHTVKSGETLLGIANKYGADTEDILEYNDMISAEDLIAGVEIVIPGGTQPAPPAPVPASTGSTQLASFTQVFTGGTPAPNAAPNYGTSLQWPTTTHRISQYYGYRHTGIDVDGEFGDPIYAADSGTVTSAGWYGGYGLQVVINHGNGITTRYAHFQKIFVATGQTVSRGQTIGEEGSTGWSTGSHLHYEVMVNGAFTNPFSHY
ncbi:MAG: M23 family metallopeptidase [Candidatus Kerfeldbacteria bacterium]